MNETAPKKGVEWKVCENGNVGRAHSTIYLLFDDDLMREREEREKSHQHSIALGHNSTGWGNNNVDSRWAGRRRSRGFVISVDGHLA